MTTRLVPALVLLASALSLAAGAQRATDLPERYKKWLDEEVVYIITPHERDVFKDLRTDRERDMFIEAFWKHRDPTPGTPRNEFREEHYGRLKYATDNYGRGSGRPGWMTDRGRTYIVLGPPKTVDSFSNVQNVYPVEIWSYLGDPALGLPTAFNVIFFKRDGAGDYIFYSPVQDGPQSLLTDSLVSAEDPEKAYQTLKKYSPDLAYQVLSLIPGERQFQGSISLASTKLMATIFESPQKKVEDSYADAILKYKDFIEVEYTANYVPCDATTEVLRSPSGAFMVHYSVEPGKISVEDAGGNKYGVDFRVNGRVSDASGRTIYQFDRDFPFTLSTDALEAARRASISLQDVFPLAPGSYNFDLLVKNPASKEFSSAERKLVVPEANDGPQMGSLVLAYKAEARPEGAGEPVPFQVGREQLLCQSRKTFGAKEKLVVFFQVYGLTEDLRASGSFRFAFLKEDKPFSDRRKKIAEYGPGADFLEVQDLSEFPPGYYRVQAALLDGRGQEVTGGKADFEVIALPEFPRPMVIAKVRPSSGRADYLYETGLQYLNKGDDKEAAARLTEAYRLAPGRLEIAVAYGQLLFTRGEFQKVKDILTPFAGGEEPPAEVVSLLGRTCHALNDFQGALSYYTSYLKRFGMNVDILNYVGTCHYQLGNRDEALKAWTKSLEVNPKQDRIRALVESLTKK
jgi:GWxTD domain-containing protein